MKITQNTSKKDKGFGAAGLVLVLLVIGLLVTTGWLFYSKHKDSGDAINNTSANSAKQSNDSAVKDESPKTYTLDNEGLKFDYNPAVSKLAEIPGTVNENSKSYEVGANVTTGAIMLSVRTGVDGRGGNPVCMKEDSYSTCKVIDTKPSTFLGNPITYRLIEAKVPDSCGYSGVPSCDDAPKKTLFILDTYKSDDYFGVCCNTIDVSAKNLGKKAETAGNLMIDIKRTDGKFDFNESLFKGSDMLTTIKIIESMRY